MSELILIEKGHGDVVRDVEVLLSHLTRISPQITIQERDHPFVECINFADYVKQDGMPGIFQKPWHVVDNPLFLNEPNDGSDRIE